MAQILTKVMLRDFNTKLMNREIKQKFSQGDAMFPGFERDPSQLTTDSIIVGRIYTPRSETKNLHTVNKVVKDSAEPGEIRITFDPDLTAKQVGVLDTLLEDHVVTGRTPRQTAQDEDSTKLDDLKTFYSDDAFDKLASSEQNKWMLILTRYVLRKEGRLDSEN